VKHPFDLLVFDWDGTLMDSIHRIVESIQGSAQRCGCDIPSEEACRGIIGLGLDEALEDLFPGSPPGTKTNLVECYREIFQNQKICPGDLFAGVSELLVQLKAEGYLLAIATGKNRSGLQNAMQRTGIATLFDASRCADETASKPNPAMLLEILDECDVSKYRTLMIGDTVHDLRMARNADIKAVAVCCGADQANVLLGWDPLVCLEQTRYLANFLCSQRLN